MTCAICWNFLFILPTTPFFWGLLAMQNYLPMPFRSQKLKNSCDINSPPLLYLQHLNFRSNSIYTKALNILNLSNASYLYFSKPIKHILLNSSINNMNYCSPWGDFFLIGPHKSVWTNSRILLDVTSLDLNKTLDLLPNLHYLKMLFSGGEMFDKSWIATILLNLYNWEKQILPNLLYQS